MSENEEFQDAVDVDSTTLNTVNNHKVDINEDKVDSIEIASSTSNSKKKNKKNKKQKKKVGNTSADELVSENENTIDNEKDSIKKENVDVSKVAADEIEDDRGIEVQKEEVEEEERDEEKDKEAEQFNSKLKNKIALFEQVDDVQKAGKKVGKLNISSFEQKSEQTVVDDAIKEKTNLETIKLNNWNKAEGKENADNLNKENDQQSVKQISDTIDAKQLDQMTEAFIDTNDKVNKDNEPEPENTIGPSIEPVNEDSITEPPISRSTDQEEDPSIFQNEELQKEEHSLKQKLEQLKLLDEPSLEAEETEEDGTLKSSTSSIPKRAQAPELPNRELPSAPAPAPAPALVPPTLPPRSPTGLQSELPPLPPRHDHHSSSSETPPPPLPHRHKTLSPEDFQPPPLPPQLTASQKAKHKTNTSFTGIGSWFNRGSVSSRASVTSSEAEKIIDYDENYDLLLSRLTVNNEDLESKDESSRELLNTSITSLRASFAEKVPHLKKEEDEEGAEHEHEVGEEEEPEKNDIIGEIDWPFWTNVVNDYSQVVKSDPAKLSKKISEGIPDSIRGIVWQLVVGSNAAEFVEKYQELTQQESPFAKAIQKDISRTAYISDYGINEDSLYRVIKAYSNLDTEVGYTQGMAFITVPLLLKLDELEAFGLLYNLMTKYNIRSLYLPEMPGLLLILYQFDRLVEDQLPNLHNHFLRQGVRSSMYATQWFLTFFAYKFPLKFVLRIYDIIITEGYESLLKFAIALVAKNEENLLNLKFDQLLEFLKESLFNIYVKDQGTEEDRDEEEEEAGVEVESKLSFGDIFRKPTSKPITVETYDVDQLVEDATNVKIVPITLKRYQDEFEEIHRLEKERQEEVDQLKLRNTQLRKEIKKIESSYTILNREHVQVANEMIQGRVKIATLEDEIKDLKEQNHNLKERVKSLLQNPTEEIPVPSSLEEDLKLTMERNLEVMTKNQELEDQVSSLLQEMEQLKAQLVNDQKGSIETSHLKPSSPLKGSSWKFFKS